jgi:hypothetical protein
VVAPARSSQPPHAAADKPSKTKKEGVHPAETGDVPVAVDGEKLADKQRSGQATLLSRPTARDSGNQKTLKPYAIPMQRWMQSAPPAAPASD